MEIRQKATCEDDAIFLSFLTHAEHVCKTFSTKCFLSGSNHATKHGERWEAVGEGAAEGREQSGCLGLPGRRGGASSRAVGGPASCRAPALLITRLGNTPGKARLVAIPPG